MVKRERDREEKVAKTSKKSKKSFSRSMQAAKQAARLLAEKKEVTTSTTGSQIYGGTPANGATVTLLNSVAQGSDSTQRIGRKVKHEYVIISVAITTAIATGDFGFWSIVLDRQPNGAAPAFADIYDTATVNNCGIVQKGTLLYQDRFKVLAQEDWAVTVNAQGPPYFLKRYISLQNAHGDDSTANFNGTGSGIGNINQGAIFFVIGQGGGGVIGTPTTYYFASKYRFTDA